VHDDEPITGSQRLGLTVTGVYEASGQHWCVVNLDLNS